MILKDIRLDFFDCESVVRINSDEGSGTITFSVTELVLNEDKTTEDNTVYSEASCTEVYLGNKEVKSIIKALESSLIEGDEL